MHHAASEIGCRGDPGRPELSLDGEVPCVAIGRCEVIQTINFLAPNERLEERQFDLFLHQFLVNGSYHFLPPGEESRPFVTVGIGLTRFSPTEAVKQRALTEFL